MAGYLSRLRSALLNVARNQYDGLALQSMRPLQGQFVPWTGAALRPSALQAVLNDIVVHRRRSILELGSGLSTLYIAKLLDDEADGRLVTVEHDEGWLVRVRSWLEREGLTERVIPCLAPLVDIDMGGDRHRWYDPSRVDQAVRSLGCPIDLLLVDGPPASEPGRHHARLPALPLLHRHLAHSCTVILDDADRRGERAVIRRWEAEFDLSFRPRRLAGGIAVAQRNSPYQV